MGGLVTTGHRLFQSSLVGQSELEVRNRSCMPAVSKMAESRSRDVMLRAFLVLWRDDRVLLLRCWDEKQEQRSYRLIDVKLDGDDPAPVRLARQAHDDLGIVVVSDDLSLVHVAHRRTDRQYVDLFFATRVWAGAPALRTPSYCDELQWAEPGRLPEGTAVDARGGLEGIYRGRLFSMVGWSSIE